MSIEKLEFLERSKAFWNPGKTQDWQDMGVDLVIDRREGYYLYDMDGRRLIDLHLNGGTYNLGHRHPELVEVLNAGARRFDMGNHHFPALARTALAEAMAACAPTPDLRYTAYGSGGGEAIDIALKTARHATQKRKIVSIIKGYHGHTGLAVKAGDERFSKLFLSEDTVGEFVQVPFNDLNAMEDALRGRDVAAVIMESIPATYGFPMPVRAICQGSSNSASTMTHSISLMKFRPGSCDPVKCGAVRDTASIPISWWSARGYPAGCTPSPWP